MNETDILLRLLLVVVFGIILGLETETRNRNKKFNENSEKSKIGGLRTYTILSLFGGISGVLYYAGEVNLVYLSFLSIIVLIGAAYFKNIEIREAFGMTTEIAIFITFLLGFLTTSNLISIPVSLFILILLGFFLSQKHGLSGVIQNIKHQEVIDLMRFGLISLVVLPILPNKTYTLGELLSVVNENLIISEEVANISLLNPFRVWFVVVLISGISMASYVVSRVLGTKQGIFVTALIGGLFSSTATTVAFAHKSKKVDKSQAPVLSGAAVIANAVSLVSIALVISILNIQLFSSLILPLITMFLIGIIAGSVLIINNNKKTQIEQIPYEPFSILPAIKFVGIIILLTLIIQGLQFVDARPIYIAFVTAISGVTGIDAPTISTAELLNTSQISLGLAVVIFLATNMVNFTSKAIIGKVLGTKQFALYLALGLCITLLGMFAVLI